MSREIKAKKQAEKEAKKERRRANLKRAAENQRKSEIVQVVSIFDQIKHFITYLYYKYEKHIKRIIYIMLKLDSIIVFRSVHIKSYDIYYKIYKCRRDQYR